MDLFDVARSCLRRWYVVLPLLLIALWYSHHVYKSVKPVYYSSAAIGLAPPSTHVVNAIAGVGVPRNGLLDVGGPTLIANLTAMGLRDPAVVAQVVAAGGNADYISKMFPVPPTMPELPLVTIEATEPDPAAAGKTVELVVAQADPVLRKLQAQANVPADQMATPFVVSPPSVPAAGMPSRIRSTIAISVAGVGIAILIGVVVDVLMMRWKARRQQRQETPVRTVGGPTTPNGARNVDLQDEHAVADEVAMDSR